MTTHNTREGEGIEEVLEQVYCSLESHTRLNGLNATDSDGIELVLEELRHTLHQELQKAREVTENTSDGYHTFKELYEFRLLYNAHLFNEWAKRGMYYVHKSTKHSDGEDCFGGGWFIVVASLPSGDISNHYEMKDWDLFRCDIRPTAKEWDGHTAQDVAQRLREALTQSELDQHAKKKLSDASGILDFPNTELDQHTV